MMTSANAQSVIESAISTVAEKSPRHTDLYHIGLVYRFSEPALRHETSNP